MIPSSDFVLELDAFNMVPKGVSVHFTRIPLPQPDTPEIIMELAKDVEKYAKLFSPLGVDVIAFGCTAGSFIGGPGYDQQIIDRISKVSGTKATTTSTSVVAALKTLKIKSISVLAPYVDEVVQKLGEFLKENGFDVPKIKGLGLDADLKIALVSPEDIYRHAKSVFVPEAEGLFISCTTFRASDVIEVLERDLGVPVVTANQATLWNMLRMAGIKEKIDGYGQLFSRH
jgi:maleate isomerase